MLQASTQLVVVVQLLSHVRLLATPWGAAHQASLSFTVLQSLLKLMSIESMMPSNHLVLCCLLHFWPSTFLSIKVFSSKLNLHFRWPKHCSFQLQHQSFKWIFKVDFLQDWLVWSPLCPRGPQESSPAPHFESISSLVFSFHYGPTLTSIHDYWKNNSSTCIDLCWQVMSPLFNMLSRFVIAFLLRSKHLLISWLQSPSAVILVPKKIKVSLFPLFPHLFVMKW